MKKIVSLVFFCTIFGAVSAQTVQLNRDSLGLALKEVSTVEGCRMHANTVKAAAAYCLYTPFSDDDVVRRGCEALVIQWTTNTDEIDLQISSHMHNGLLDKKVKQGVLLVTYIAAADLYAITTGLKETTAEAYFYAMEETLQFYRVNKKVIGKSKYMERLLKMSEAERTAEYQNLFDQDHLN